MLGGRFAGLSQAHRRQGDDELEGSRATCGQQHTSVEDEVEVRRPTGAHEEDTEKRDAGANHRIGARARAVARLIESSNVSGCSTGKSAGFAPLRILST